MSSKTVLCLHVNMYAQTKLAQALHTTQSRNSWQSECNLKQRYRHQLPAKPQLKWADLGSSSKTSKFTTLSTKPNLNAEQKQHIWPSKPANSTNQQQQIQLGVCHLKPLLQFEIYSCPAFRLVTVSLFLLSFLCSSRLHPMVRCSFWHRTWMPPPSPGSPMLLW